jgi:type IV/VI secretion system ImpK/VasF family protein
MTLLELCEPLFLKICELNRMGRQGHRPDFLEARSEIKTLLDEIASPSGADARLAAQARKVELPLACFVDSIIASSRLHFANQWRENRLAAEPKHNELAGDDRFFALLEETLNDPGDDASERLAVFYVCIGLGFTGACAGQPEELKRHIVRILPRIKGHVDVDTRARLCPDAYKSVDTRNLVPEPAPAPVMALILFVFFSVATMIICYAMYVNATEDLFLAVKTLLQAPAPM